MMIYSNMQRLGKKNNEQKIMNKKNFVLLYYKSTM